MFITLLGGKVLEVHTIEMFYLTGRVGYKLKNSEKTGSVEISQIKTITDVMPDTDKPLNIHEIPSTVESVLNSMPAKVNQQSSIDKQLEDSGIAKNVVFDSPKMVIVHHIIAYPTHNNVYTGKEPKKYAGFVHAKSLQDAYRKSQHIEGSTWDKGERSTSIGDFLQVDDQLFMVMPMGFALMVEEGEEA